MTTHQARTVSVSIDRGWREVYDFLCVPENFARWASGLGSGLERAGEEWTARGPQGPIRVRFSPLNDFGVLDHVVVTEAGAEIRCPMRVVANGTGCEVLFTLFRMPGASPEAFAADAKWVARDLDVLRGLLNPKAPSRHP